MEPVATGTDDAGAAIMESGTMHGNDHRGARRFEDARCAAMAIGALTALVGSFWMAGILF